MPDEREVLYPSFFAVQFQVFEIFKPLDSSAVTNIHRLVPDLNLFF